ncbi:hypothetical protein E2C01_024541 [Portunus trituberculatus]|uniref:Uncharacterized protein n=1 Tax=Portunus trituberculatus TaxID=210409 RepID=A0A5B7ED46_PORTR|nr:hypothetical protein [Portunus trituberculatus]
MAVTAAALQPDTPLPPVISFKSLPKDLITHDPYAHLHTFSEDHHDVLQNNIPHQSFSLRIKDALPSKFIRFPSTSHTVTPHRHASSSFRKPSLGYDIDSYFTGFPVFGFFDFNPDRAGLTTRTHLPPFPQFPEDIPLKGSKVSLHAPYHATHHTSKAMVTQQIHHKSRSNPKQFRTRVPRQAMFFLGPPSMPSNPKPRTSTILF